MFERMPESIETENLSAWVEFLRSEGDSPEKTMVCIMANNLGNHPPVPFNPTYADVMRMAQTVKPAPRPGFLQAMGDLGPREHERREA